MYIYEYNPTFLPLLLSKVQQGQMSNLSYSAFNLASGL